MKKRISPNDFMQTMQDRYANEICHLNWDKKRPWTLLFAVILSAQCTDKRVNQVTPILFKEYPDLESYVAKPIEELEQTIKSTGFFRNKAKSIQGASRYMLLEHNGNVPNTMEEMVKLPGVGRKTANVILWNLFGKNEGMVVDTHIGRISYRVGFTTSKNPIKIERDLMKILPKKQWGQTGHRMVQFGRDYCKAPTPLCSQCPLQEKCPRHGVIKFK